jgi:hypothetical protein
MSYLNFSTAFARPADTNAYTAGDIIANNTTAGSVVVPSLTLPRIGTGIKITGGVLRKSGASVTNADFAVHLFSGSTVPVPTAGDNAAFNATQVLATTGGADYSGFLTGAKANIRVVTGGTFCPLTVGVLPYILINATPAGLSLNFLIEALAAYAPNSAETFSLGLYYEPIVDDPTV